MGGSLDIKPIGIQSILAQRSLIQHNAKSRRIGNLNAVTLHPHRLLNDVCCERLNSYCERSF